MMAAAGEQIAPGRTAEDWPLRPWLLAGLLGFAGLLISLLTDFGNDEEPWRVAATAFVFFGGIAAALTVERTDWKAPAIFAAIVGLVLAGLAWRAVSYGESLPDEEYGFAAGVVASLLALPLFKAGFLKKRLATSYSDTHYHVWSDAISGAGALVFVGISWAVLFLLSELFHLLKIDLIRDLIDEEWFGWSFSGIAFGAALGTLRNQLKILGMLQSVVFLVLSLLGVPLAAALVLFLLAVAITGPDVLWEATRSATPLLLSCAVGAFVLTNAIIRDDDEAASKSKVLRIAGLVLGLGILPLSVFAAYSMGIRLSQHGFSPERLWGMLAILVACFYGLAYWIGAVRGRKSGWREQFRRANFFMALAVCGLALFMALPILDFGGISTRNQVARLNNGTVSAEDFDYAALKWDFGAAGTKALERLASSDLPKVAELAQDQLDREDRPWRGMNRRGGQTTTEMLASADIRTEDPELRAAAEKYLRANPWTCSSRCTVLDLGVYPDTNKPHLAVIEGLSVRHLALGENGELVEDYMLGSNNSSPDGQVLSDENKGVEVRPFVGRQIYVDGRPVSQPFE